MFRSRAQYRAKTDAYLAKVRHNSERIKDVLEMLSLQVTVMSIEQELRDMKRRRADEWHERVTNDIDDWRRPVFFWAAVVGIFWASVGIGALIA